jgi:soluble lytic murein transglycosylase-like protein
VVARVALAHGLRPSLIHAVIEIESGHSQSARSPKGAVGLMQVMPATAVAYGLGDLRSPEGNIQAGVRHLRDLLSRHSLPLALAAYNAGEGAVLRYGGIPPFAETRTYVERVLIAFQRLSEFLPSHATSLDSKDGPDQATSASVQPLGVSSVGPGDSAIISQ